MSDCRFRRVELKNHALLGRVVRVDALIFGHAETVERDATAAHIYPDEAAHYLLTFEDGRQCQLDAQGYETEGVSVNEPREIPEEVK